MSWMGKILGGGIGLMLGGPIGMVIGAVLGHHAVDSQGDGLLSGLETRQTIYFVATFSMLGKIAKADGVVTRHEIDAIDKVMRDNLRLAPQAREFAIKVFNEAKDSSQPFEVFARQFYEEFRSTPEILVSEIELLLLVALADADLQQTEQQMILTAVRIFGLENEYDRIKARFRGLGEDIDRYYQILGCHRGDSLSVIKKKYRKLAMEYHPDRVQSKGMSPEFAKVAEDKFKEIQHAYDMVEKHLASR